MFGETKWKKKREMGGTLALGSHHFIKRHNNQPTVTVQGSYEVGEEAQLWWSVWGDIIELIWATNRIERRQSCYR